ncbi:MAG: tetratricopeptide repeat protein [Cyclobacteriaceae bacterium]|nr:tetratricopeptide repeat protein [Cyclobacteriaceae bacterium]UYN86208.1 MAG: tetratricopeptide repeat protein [Cyclobacteriaceae bacterium]
MPVRLVLFIGFILWVNYCPGQDLNIQKTDSLLKLIDKTEKPELTFQLYHQLAGYTTDQNASLNYEQQALAAALQTNNNQLIADAYTNLGIHYRKHSEYATAISYYMKALAAGKNDTALLNTYLELGIAHLRLAKFDSSAYYLTKGITISTEQNNQPMTASFYNMMGNVLKEKNNYKEAVDYYLKATEIFEHLQDDNGLTQSLSNIGNLQNLMGDYDKALEYAQQSLTIAEKINKQPSIAYSNRLLGRIYRKLQKYDDALLVYQKAIEVYETIGARRDVSETLTSMGNIYYEKEDLNKAKSYYTRSLSISKSLSDSANMTYSYAALGSASAQLRQHTQAVLYFDSTIRIARQIKLPALVMDSYLGLSELYADQKKFDLAYHYHLRYTALNDSLTALQNREEAANREALYQNEKKENEIRTLNTENELAMLRLQQQESQRNYLIGILALSLALIGLLGYLYNAKQKINKKLETLNQVQSRFFANISHEFRTPLSLIIGPLQKTIQENPHAPEAATWKIMHRNAVRLHRLINEILDLSKIESGNMKLRTAEGDLKQFLKTVFASFISLAEQKQIDYTLHAPDGSVTGYFDRDKLEKIVSNLIYNALKFTPEGGHVQLSITHINHQLTVQVKDTGPGIPADQLTQIFNRFHQIEGTAARIVEGTGLGLALSKELAEAHHGTLTAESPETGGSIFTLTIPTARSFYKSELTDQVETSELIYDEYPVDEQPVESTATTDRPVILIAEDHADMRTFIHQVIAEQFDVVMTENGDEAWSKALHHIPDLVISDLMMPGINGTELCKRLKTHEATSHIPVIMLTARADQESKLEGLHTGADDYLTKPFDARELLARIQNLVEQRKKLKAIFSQQASSFTRVAGESRDTAFYNKVISIIEKNFTDPAFGIEEFTREIGMSRMQLHRKLKALTDQSPGDFLRLFRLGHAKKLLSIKGISVSEAAYRSGFNNLPNFSRIFKAWAGVTPSEYQENSLSENPAVTNQQDIVTNP